LLRRKREAILASSERSPQDQEQLRSLEEDIARVELEMSLRRGEAAESTPPMRRRRPATQDVEVFG
ncbi:unnamed protein product, partial [Polarella glacialis]